MDSVGPVDNSSITSRLSLQKLCSVVSQFSDFKRDLIKEIGFGGALAIQPRKKINLKLSSWLMDRVDVDSCSLNIEGHPPVVIFDQDVEDVLALPCGKRSISAEGVDPSNACIEYTRFAAALSQKGTHSLKAAEVYLMRDITSESSALEIECFKIAFVVFYVGHVLAPSAKHDYIFIDFWAALNDSSKLTDWNWCAYVLKHLFAVVRKFKTDVAKRNSTIHLVRNHIFLQVKYLDLLDLGTHSRPINIGPHIGLYDYDSMKKIVDRISVNLGNDTSFHGASFRNVDKPSGLHQVNNSCAATR
uniref:Uncharacterized protein n=1 Tax=Avena sativa TaxID=4498 RepID=A0ACD6A5R0_AVESA